jgi:hypothetical protein
MKKVPGQAWPTVELSGGQPCAARDRAKSVRRPALQRVVTGRYKTVLRRGKPVGPDVTLQQRCRARVGGISLLGGAMTLRRPATSGNFGDRPSRMQHMMWPSTAPPDSDTASLEVRDRELQNWRPRSANLRLGRTHGFSDGGTRASKNEPITRRLR